MLRFTLIVFIHFFITLAMAATLFVILPLNGDYWGVALAQLWTLGVVLLGDRALLSSLKAKRLGESASLVQKIANLRALRRCEKRFEVFNSRELPNNILLIDSFFRAPALVIGSDVVAHVRDEDLTALLSVAIERLEKNKWRYASVSAQLLSIFALPMVLFSLGKRPSTVVGILASPADVITDMAWKAGGVSLQESSSVNFAKESYPKLWGEAHPRISRVFKPFMSRLLGRFLLVSPIKSSVLVSFRAADIKQPAENA